MADSQTVKIELLSDVNNGEKVLKEGTRVEVSAEKAAHFIEIGAAKALGGNDEDQDEE